MQESAPRLHETTFSALSRVFRVDISENPTVSYKRLLKDAEAREQAALPPVPAGANPALEARFAPSTAPAPPAEEVRPSPLCDIASTTRVIDHRHQASG